MANIPERLDSLIDMALTDGVITDFERSVLVKKAQSFGIDEDELNLIIDAKIQEKYMPTPPPISNIPSQRADTPKISVKETKEVCPNCGAVRPAMATACPDCGYEYTTARTTAVQMLSQQLEELQTTAQTMNFRGRGLEALLDNSMAEEDRRNQFICKREKEIIQNFPIPHTKAEILDLIYYIQPKAIANTISQTTFAWQEKFSELLIRAKIVFADDKQKLDLIVQYEREFLNTRKNKRIRLWWNGKSPQAKARWIIFPINALIILCLGIILPITLSTRDKEVNRYLACDEIDKAYLVYAENPTKISDDVQKRLLTSLVKQNKLEQAEAVLESYDGWSSDKGSLSTLIMNAYIQRGNKHAVDNLYILYKDYPGVEETYTRLTQQSIPGSKTTVKQTTTPIAEPINKSKIIRINDDVYKTVSITDCRASSTLPPMSKFSYDAANLIDGDLKTAWAMKRNDGQYLTFNLPDDIRMIGIYNGYIKSDMAFYNNDRVAQMRLFIDDVLVGNIELKDTKECQYFSVSAKAGQELKFSLDAFYEGKKYDDVNITEILFLQ